MPWITRSPSKWSCWPERTLPVWTLSARLGAASGATGAASPAAGSGVATRRWLPLPRSARRRGASCPAQGSETLRTAMGNRPQSRHRAWRSARGISPGSRPARSITQGRLLNSAGASACFCARMARMAGRSRLSKDRVVRGTRAARRVRSPPSISALPLAPQGKGVEGDGVEAGGLQLAQVAVVVGAGGGEHLPVMFAEAAQGLVPVEIEQPRQGKYLAAALILVRGVAHRAVAEGARAVIEPLVDEGEGGGEGVVLALDGQAEVGPGAVEIVHGSVLWEG